MQQFRDQGIFCAAMKRRWRPRILTCLVVLYFARATAAGTNLIVRTIRLVDVCACARNLPPITYDRLSPLPTRLVVPSTCALAVVGFMNCFCRRYFARLLSD